MIFFTQVGHLVDRGSRARGILQCKAVSHGEAEARLSYLAYISGFKAIRRDDQGQIYFIDPKPIDMHVQQAKETS